MSVADTGVRDASIEPVVAALLGFGKQLRKRNGGSSLDVQLKLDQELERLLGIDTSVEDRINPLLGMKGKASLILQSYLIASPLQTLTFIKTPLLRCFIPFS